MPKKISISIGFVTNSSSVVHHFPRELLDHPKVKMFIEKFELQHGFVGDDLWHRARCDSFLVAHEQKAEVAQNFRGDNYLSGSDHTATGPAIDMDPNKVVLIYGDEYDSVARDLCSLLLEALCEKEGPEARWGVGNQYN
jgi:hypothetical protein